MDGLREEPNTELLSEMEGFEHIWDDEKQRYGIRLQRNSLPDYATVDFWEALRMWRDWKMFGFPKSGGSDDQGALYMDIIRTMQLYADKMGVG
jgi:hypothetical protein